MRRLLLILLLIAVPLGAVSPVLAGASLPRTSVHTKATPVKHKKHCKKVKKGKRVKKVCKKAPKKHATPMPTATAPLPTATNTPAPTATFTQVSTPGPYTSSMAVAAQIQPGYFAGFYMCGLPAGIAAAFVPSVVQARSDPRSAIGGSARTTLRVTTPAGTHPGVYGLSLRAMYRDSGGHQLALPPGGATIVPAWAELTVNGDGTTSLSPSDDASAETAPGCTDPPSGFAPTPTATPGPGDVQISSPLFSDTQPARGERVSLTDTIRVQGAGVSGLPMRVDWYFDEGLKECQGVTDANGTASCSVAVSSTAVPNQVVQVDVAFTFNGLQYYTYGTVTVTP